MQTRAILNAILQQYSAYFAYTDRRHRAQGGDLLRKMEVLYKGDCNNTNCRRNVEGKHGTICDRTIAEPSSTVFGWMDR